jgi:aminopeptidase YwaD
MLTSSLTVGVANLTNNNENFKIYPNPASTILNIDIANADQSKISIMNYLGQTNFTTTNQKQIDITNFTSGLYFITIEFGHKIFTQKFIKQ